MAKIETETVKAKASKTPSSKTGLVEVTKVDKTAEVTEAGKKGPSGQTLVKGEEPKPSTAMAPLSAEDLQVLRRAGAKLLTSAQIDGSVSITCSHDKVVDLALQHGAQGLVDEFAPADAVESTYAPVIVGIRNAVMTSLRLATRGSVERRDCELTTAFKGAGVLAQLLEAFDAHRGHGGRRFTVGNVNVESGAQAIVGNVETTPRQEPGTEDSAVNPNKRKPRAT
jgi:hypothetical protein